MPFTALRQYLRAQLLPWRIRRALASSTFGELIEFDTEFDGGMITLRSVSPLTPYVVSRGGRVDVSLGKNQSWITPVSWIGVHTTYLTRDASWAAAAAGITNAVVSKLDELVIGTLQAASAGHVNVVSARGAREAKKKARRRGDTIITMPDATFIVPAGQLRVVSPGWPDVQVWREHGGWYTDVQALVPVFVAATAPVTRLVRTQ